MSPKALPSPSAKDMDEFLADDTDLDEIIQNVSRLPFIAATLEDSDAQSQKSSKDDEARGASPRGSPRIEEPINQDPKPSETPKSPVAEPITGVNSSVDAGAEGADPIPEPMCTETDTTPPTKDWQEALTGADTAKSSGHTSLESDPHSTTEDTQQPDTATAPDPNLTVSNEGALISKGSANVVDADKPNPDMVDLDGP